MARFRVVRAVWMRQETAAAIVEYALLVAFIALACLLALQGLGRGFGRFYNNVVTTVNGVPTNSR